ncbi:hypothetical protein F5880DRAFT_1505885 [Lentinula raphanica]|nr:hypothetical protein F5880DRAFT_1505885 [Lentinula raphanica]
MYATSAHLVIAICLYMSIRRTTRLKAGINLRHIHVPSSSETHADNLLIEFQKKTSPRIALRFQTLGRASNPTKQHANSYDGIKDTHGSTEFRQSILSKSQGVGAKSDVDSMACPFSLHPPDIAFPAYTLLILGGNERVKEAPMSVYALRSQDTETESTIEYEEGFTATYRQIKGSSIELLCASILGQCVENSKKGTFKRNSFFLHMPRYCSEQFLLFPLCHLLPLVKASGWSRKHSLQQLAVP